MRRHFTLVDLSIDITVEFGGNPMETMNMIASEVKSVIPHMPSRTREELDYRIAAPKEVQWSQRVNWSIQYRIYGIKSKSYNHPIFQIFDISFFKYLFLC